MRAGRGLLIFDLWMIGFVVCASGALYEFPAGAAKAQESGAKQSASSEAPAAAGRSKVAEGEYEIYEQANSGAVGPFHEEMYDFHESWTLWRSANGEYRVEGARHFQSPREEAHNDAFSVDLTRDLTVIRLSESANLRWVPDSGPLSCEFREVEMDCASSGPSPERAIHMRLPLANPYGLLWPVSPFSLSGITREMERDLARPEKVDLVSIEQPSAKNPVQPTVLEGPLYYLGESEIDAAGRKWQAHVFSLRVPLHPEYRIWTSSKGLLLALAAQHAHPNWPEEGLRLSRFEGSPDLR